MLELAEWIIPDEAKAALTPAECFILTLSIYFHDLGLLITRSEFKERKKSGYTTWVEDHLFKGTEGEDYQSRLNEMETDVRERLLYQEFVRYNHGSRVRAWLEGSFKSELGLTDNVVSEIQLLVGKLSLTLRRDIAKVCESHNLDDIEDTNKYGLSQPYGNSDKEEADLQYIATILRTVDLLQISNSRAPSALYRVISPSDPISQVEWHKQNAVTRVRRKTMTDQEGRSDAALPSDTIEVFAHFDQAEGFFGLTSYLRYAESQLERSFQAIEKSRKQHGGIHTFPWRKVDDRKVEAEGFIPRTFGFELDQKRILTLLTGHTLYNDSSVVIRELVQNAIDAVRLQWRSDDVSKVGKVTITWDSDKGELTVSDNGTGMTQDIVERHLLKVGSSRYQDSQFKKDYPDFNPISRFGIGVLTAFMVADSVEIITVTPEEDEARQISLRTVHGKYLIRLLPKDAEAVLPLGLHGTSISLRLRPSAKQVDVLSTVQRWIVFPGCDIEVLADNEPAVQVGFARPADALDSYLKTFKGKRLIGTRSYRIIEKEVSGVDLAYAIAKDEFFKDWSLVGSGDPRTRQDDENAPIGTCIQGIAVDFNTPGFDGQTILAIANATGSSAPRTNVARSAIEDTKERLTTISKIYNLFAEQVKDEVNRLSHEEEYSLSWAVGQAPFIAAPYTSPRAAQIDRGAFAESVSQLPLFLLESGGKRISASLDELVEKAELWLIEAPLIRSVESLIREAATDVTARSIIEVTHGTGWLPQGDIISNATTSALALDTLQRRFELKEIRAVESERRIDARLGLIGDDTIWLNSDKVIYGLRQLDTRAAYQFTEMFRDRARSRQSSASTYIPLCDVPIAGLEGYGSVDVLRATYLLPGHQVGTRIVELYQEGTFESLAQATLYIEVANVLRSRGSRSQDANVALITRFMKQIDTALVESSINTDELLVSVREGEFRYFDPLAWTRREEGTDAEF
ncbi:ATP-binding protein [Sphingomonas sp. Leaf28]|uniref:HD domain-containing protein n=1 Tax=Sphingomonas sp. Leaf28 TaxID=1735695 RepID=UPI001F2C91EA|nr:ATP-binding protein [Sphingomonas sp. Leaf28]